MGSSTFNACCGSCRHKPLLTDNDAENLIRNILYSVKIRDVDIEHFIECVDSNIKTKSFDTMKTIRKWITKEEYTKILNQLFYYEDNNHIKYSEYHNSLVISYEVTEEDRLFGFIFYCWAISLCQTSTTKIHYMYQIIKALNSSYNAVNFETFKRFLNTYLQINLAFFTNQITEKIDFNKYPCTSLQSQFDELPKIFNINNIEKFQRTIVNELEDILKRESSLTNIKNNEIISQATIENLLERHSYLLDCVDIRERFYNQFAFKM